MKNFVFALVLVFVSAFPRLALGSEIVASCQNLELYQQDETGKGSFKPADMSITVSKSSLGKYGYAGLIVFKNEKKWLENDTQVRTIAAADAKEIKDISAALLPNVKWDDVANVRVSVIGVKADRDDGGGINIYELLAKDQKVLGRVARVGWGFGRCR